MILLKITNLINMKKNKHKIDWLNIPGYKDCTF